MSISKELLDRLICSKYLYHKGIETLNSKGPFSSGVAVLHFQDSIEMALRVIAEFLHCSLKENESFQQIIEKIDKHGENKIPSRIALNQLNKARVNFKHFGLEPKFEDSTKFMYDIENFFPIALKTFLDIEFNSISLANLIRHQRTENHINKAKQLLDDGKFSESIAESAVALKIFRVHFNKEADRYRSDSFLHFKCNDDKLDDWARNVDNAIEEIHSQLNLITLGINVADYRKFIRYTPQIQYSMAGTYHIVYYSFGKPVEPTKDIALFCHRFVIDAILIMLSNQLSLRYAMLKCERKYKTTQETPIIVWPCDNPEIIKLANKGEIISATRESLDKPGYIAIIQDEDVAYIEKVAVVELDG